MENGVVGPSRLVRIRLCVGVFFVSALSDGSFDISVPLAPLPNSAKNVQN